MGFTEKLHWVRAAWAGRDANMAAEHIFGEGDQAGDGDARYSILSMMVLRVRRPGVTFAS